MNRIYYLDEDEYIYVKNNSLPTEICDYLINLFQHDASHLVYKGTTMNGISDAKKTFDLKLKPEINKHDNFMFEELTLNINKYFENINSKYHYQIISLENINDSGYQIQKYVSGQGLYSYHHDSDSFHKTHKTFNKTRILSFIWYLNDVADGGETEFLNGRLKVKPEMGKLLIFPATWTYMHRGNVPISEDKYIVTGWLYGTTLK